MNSPDPDAVDAAVEVLAEAGADVDRYRPRLVELASYGWGRPELCAVAHGFVRAEQRWRQESEQR